MSDMEYNKGRLIPTNLTYDDIIVKAGCNPEDIPSYYTKEEWCYDLCHNLNNVILKGVVYEVLWKVKAGELEDNLLNLTKHSDGSIDFATYHYNGCGGWESIVEAEL